MKTKIKRLPAGAKGVREIGKELGITGERVRQILHIALKKMRRALERDGYNLETILEIYQLDRKEFIPTNEQVLNENKICR
jgi:hypothetical protein